LTFHISENTRQTVIRLWIEDNSRKDIALITGASEGTVSNIIAEWRQKLECVIQINIEIIIVKIARLASID
jgi:DNA-directed RNA polymerase specialized sigma24 family protein